MHHQWMLPPRIRRVFRVATVLNAPVPARTDQLAAEIEIHHDFLPAHGCLVISRNTGRYGDNFTTILEPYLLCPDQTVDPVETAVQHLTWKPATQVFPWRHQPFAMH